MIKLAEIPHYVLSAEAQLESFRGESLGHWRFVLQSSDGAFRFDASDWEPNVTLDRLELLTVIRGLEELDQSSVVTIMTGSNYVIHGFGFGLREWRQNGWQWEQFGDVVPIANGDLWRRLDRANQYHKIRCQRSSSVTDTAELPAIAIHRPAVSSGVQGIPPTRRLGRWMRQLTRVASSIVPV